MSLRQWLGNMTISQFVTEYYYKLPYSQTCGDSTVRELGQWDVLERIASSGNADVMIVREGRRFEGVAYTDPEGLRDLAEQGYTILVRHAEAHDERLKQLADDFQRSLRAPVNIHMYATPAEKFGFDWHYDAEDVFILQTAGQKEYGLRKNTVNPWPLVENMPDDLKYERELMPLIRCLLKAGDWLYIPNGYWHKAEAVGDEIAVSLAVGVMAHSALAVWDHLRTELADSLLWRQRLPIAGSDQQLEQRTRQDLAILMQQLATDIERRLTDEKLIDSLLDEIRENKQF